MFDRNQIETYAAAGPRLREAIAGLTAGQMAAHPVPGTWSIQQIVVHVNDSDAVGIDRMKRVASMDRPLLIGYDENAFMRHLHVDQQPVEDVLTQFDLGRRLWALTLRLLPDEAFDRWGVHNERGKMTLAELVADYIRHFEHHLGFIRRKRDMLVGRTA